MYLNQYKQNKNDSINDNKGGNSRNNKNDDDNTIIISIVITIVMIITSLFQPSDFSAGYTTVMIRISKTVTRYYHWKLYIFETERKYKYRTITNWTNQ